jgi:polar amino acid transport system permease protein
MMMADLTAILVGVPASIALTLVAFTIGALLGMPLCALRLSQSEVVRFFASSLILTCRAIPPIVWLFFIFFGLAFGYVQLDPFTAASIGLGLITAANMAEIYRGALSAVHVGQWEAATVLNLSLRHRFADVIGPQMLRIALPSGATYAIGLLKDSAVASAIGVHEIAFQAYHVSQETFRGLDVYVSAGLLYIVLSLPMAGVARWADSRLRASVAL